MKVTQENETTFKVILNDAELDDLTHEAVHSKISTLDVMKAVFLMTFVQLCSCRYFRRTLCDMDKRMIESVENALDKPEPDGG